MIHPPLLQRVRLGLGDNAEQALLYGSLVNAYVFMKGEQDVLVMYKEKFNEAMQRLEVLGDGRLKRDSYRDGRAKDRIVMFKIDVSVPKDESLVQVNTTDNRGLNS